MPRYKTYSYAQGKFIPIHFEQQIIPGTFEYSLNHRIDQKLDLSIFDERYRNEETGATAYDPKILLKIILFAYSRGITSSRSLRSCLALRSVNLNFIKLRPVQYNDNYSKNRELRRKATGES